MSPSKIRKISIIIPVYNEESTIGKLLIQLSQLNLTVKNELVVVDDGSTDTTSSNIKTFIDNNKKADIKYIRHKNNKGKGAAFVTGLKKSIGDIVVIQDGDLEYPPKNIIKLIQPILQNQTDVVFGSRKLKKEKHYSSFIYYVGGALIDDLIKIVLRTTISDAICGPKAIKRNVFNKIGKIQSKGFEIETELTARLVKAKIKVIEVPITYLPRKHSEGKKIKWYDSIRILWTLIRLGVIQKP